MIAIFERIAPLILLLVVTTRANDLVTHLNGTASAPIQTFYYDDEQIKNLTNDVKVLNLRTENLGLQIELKSFSFEKQLSNQISSIKEELHQCCTARNYGHIIDVRLNDTPTKARQEISTLKAEILQEIRNSLPNCQCEANEILSQLKVLAKEVEKNLTTQGLINSIFHIPTQSKSQENSIQPASKQLPTSCALALKEGGSEGLHRLYLPTSGLPAFYAYCLKDPMEPPGSAWTILQRRQDGSENFYRSWEEYKNGFGNKSGEHFIGLEHIHALTMYAEEQELWIQLEDWSGHIRHAKYEKFAIADEGSKYRLSKLGGFSGDAGDSLSKHSGCKFTTFDSDNDENLNLNCASQYTGGWWYTRDEHCCDSNLNGPYQNAYLPVFEGITWGNWLGYDYSLKYVHLAIRPAA